MKSQTDNFAWDLETIFPITEFDKRFANLEKDLGYFTKSYKKAIPDMTPLGFKALVKQYENLVDQLIRLYARAFLWEETDQKSEEAKFYKSRIKNLMVHFDDDTRIFFLWLKGKAIGDFPVLDDAQAAKLFKETENLKYFLNRERELAKHSLDNEKESIIANKDIMGINALLDLRGLIETGHQFVLKIDGKRKIINTSSELSKYYQSSDASVRKQAYNALLNYYKSDVTKYFAIYEAVVKNWDYESKLRNYSSAINMRNVSNDISDKVIENLLTVCRSNRGMFQEFFKLKAKMLGLKKLTRFDLYAPLPKDKQITLSFSAAWDLVQKVLGDFDVEFLAAAQKVVNEKHLDVFPEKNKMSGAFCMTVTNKLTPYVMLNYTNTERDSMVLAHELGHAVHAVLASQQSIIVQDAPLPLAETASTFAEMLMFEKLYADAKTKEEKRTLLFTKISDTYATILRQNYFVLFELEAHKAIPNGIKLEDFNNIYLDNLKEQFGDSVEIDPIFKYEWAYIPHIVNSPFYCYSYSFGELLALALFNNYKKVGKPYINIIKQVLSAGGSKDPIKLLKDQGVDVTSAEFWQSGFDYLNTWIRELKKLC